MNEISRNHQRSLAGRQEKPANLPCISNHRLYPGIQDQLQSVSITTVSMAGRNNYVLVTVGSEVMNREWGVEGHGRLGFENLFLTSTYSISPLLLGLYACTV